MDTKKTSGVSYHDEEYSALDEDILDDDESVDEEEEVGEDDDDDFLNENSYTSDIEDDNPLGHVCDMPEDEVKAYEKKHR